MPIPDLSEKNLNLEVNCLKVLFWNIAGFTNKSLDSDFIHFLYNFDIVCLAETWLLEERPQQIENLFESYDFLHFPAKKIADKGRPSGGLLLAKHKRLEDTILVTDLDFPYIKFKDKRVNEYIHIVPIYLLWSDWDSMLFKLEEFLNRYTKNLILIGDFNAHIGNLGLPADLAYQESIGYIRQSSDSNIDSKGRKLVDLLGDFGFYTLNGSDRDRSNGRQTFLKSDSFSVIDYAFVTDISQVNYFDVLEQLGSDHLPIALSLDSPVAFKIEEVGMTNYTKLIWRKNKLDIKRYKNRSEFLVINSNLNSDLYYKNIIQAIYSTSVLTEQKIVYKKPWYDIECLNKRKIVMKLLRKLKGDNSIRQIFLNEQREYKQLLLKKSKAYYDTLLQHFEEVKDTKTFWTSVNILKKKVKRNTLVIGPIVLNNYFAKLLNTGDKILQIDSTEIEFKEDHYLDSKIQLDEVIKAIRSFKPGKAPGIDGISIEFFQAAHMNFFKELLKFYNFIWENRAVPGAFKQSLIVPLFKGGDRDIPSNYRGICLQNYLYKIFAMIILCRIQNWCNKKEILVESQAGFRKGYSTIDNIFVLSSLIELSFFKNRKLFVFFIDFKAAFDSVNWEALWFKLKQIGITEKVINIIKDFYVGSSCSLRVNGKITQAFPTNTGVKQGCVLSPLLFSLFINDLDEALGGYGIKVDDLNRIKVLKYADDIAILAHDPIDLNNMIKHLEVYCDKWGLTLNMKKSHIVIFQQARQTKNIKHYPWKFKGEHIMVALQYKYLGIIFTYNNSLQIHHSQKAKQAKSSLSQCLISLMNAKITKFEPKIRIFNALVRSLISYGGQVWGYTEENELEKVLRFFVKRTLFLPMNTPNYAVLGETGLEPIYLFTLKLHLNYLAKIIELPNYRYPKIILSQLIKYNLGSIQYIRKILINNNIIKDSETIQLDMLHANLEFYFEEVKLNWLLEYEFNKNNAIEHTLYKNLLSVFSHRQEYLDCCKLWQSRLISQSRCQMVQVNSMPYSLKPIDLRICSLCNLNVWEDMVHFFCECPVLSEFRVLHFGKAILYHCYDENESDLLNILNGRSGWQNLANFIQTIINYRRFIISEGFF